MAEEWSRPYSACCHEPICHPDEEGIGKEEPFAVHLQAASKALEKAVENAVTVEAVAKMAHLTEVLNPNASTVGQTLLDKHYFRKHGKNAYYGQG